MLKFFFVQVDHDGGTDYLRIVSTSVDDLKRSLPDTLNCPASAIKKIIEVGNHEYTTFPASAIKTSDGLFKIVISKVDGRYGAPMGRYNIIDQNPGKTFDRRVDICQGYDRGGAYWGAGPELRVRYNASLSHIEFYRR